MSKPSPECLAPNGAKCPIAGGAEWCGMLAYYREFLFKKTKKSERIKMEDLRKRKPDAYFAICMSANGRRKGS